MSQAPESPLETMYRRRPSFKRPPVRARSLGESISDCVYEQIGGYNRPYRRRSLYEIVVIALFKLISGLLSVLRLPVDLIRQAFREVNLLLTRKYYDILADKGRKANQEAMIAKFRAMNKETAEHTRWMLMRKAEQEAAERYEWNGDRYDPNDPDDPDKRFYNLRSRNIAAFDTDSEDDEIPRRRKTVRFDTVPSEATYGSTDFRRMSMAYRIATWLGSAASSVVYYMLSVADFAVKCVKTPYYILTGEMDSKYITPSNSREEVILHGRHPHTVRRMTAGADGDYEDLDYDLYTESEPSPLLSRFTSFCSTVLYAPCRAFLFVAFAVVDLIRWLYSRVTGAPGWFWDNFKYVVSEMVSRRRRWLWWLLPLVLLLLLLLSPRNSNDPLVIFGQKGTFVQYAKRGKVGMVNSLQSFAADQVPPNYAQSSNAEKCFYDLLNNIKYVGVLFATGVQHIIASLFDIVTYPFTLVLPEEKPLETKTFEANVGNVNQSPNIVYVPSPASSIDEKKMIERITAIKALAEVDYTHLESLIHAAISEYDSDKTGMFDFALESAGASIISTRCSENYNTYSRLEKIWNIPLWYSSYGPRTVIQRNSKTLFPGECWSFKGPVGYITIGLSHPINMTIFSYEHIGGLGCDVLTQPDYPVKIIEMEITSNYGAEYTSLYRIRVHGSLYKPGNE
ncbi:unnamed protein product [Strongylus vulgaris]|uniref:SUN domain-containing protein n=1 Tax=Strongylus vulgaris TaxID=40348 RepID=A0A3P7J959_STRVU|nr:unnamed protein product [Strongylus vulgaris]